MRVNSVMALAFLFVSALMGGCKKEEVGLPELSDPPVVEPVQLEEFRAHVPATGVASADGRKFEVAMGQDDVRQVHTGAPAWVQAEGMQAPITAGVVQVLPQAAGGGQALAWLSTTAEASSPGGAFVSAEIAVGPQRRALSVPSAAVYIFEGGTVVLVAGPGKDGADTYRSVTVRTGVRQDGRVEIVSGLKQGQRVVTAAGIGFLYPDFKAQAPN